ncbi:hypothetical protein BGY98DRAFT_933086 [Russula aff. rugulosa BPL654]|nr:hypothetical protein BGY98DRAFT_933086 [Russula aff. rugulosa BPL654]
MSVWSLTLSTGWRPREYVRYLWRCGSGVVWQGTEQEVTVDECDECKLVLASRLQVVIPPNDENGTHHGPFSVRSNGVARPQAVARQKSKIRRDFGLGKPKPTGGPGPQALDIKIHCAGSSGNHAITPPWSLLDVLVGVNEEKDPQNIKNGIEAQYNTHPQSHHASERTTRGNGRDKLRVPRFYSWVPVSTYHITYTHSNLARRIHDPMLLDTAPVLP